MTLPIMPMMNDSPVRPLPSPYAALWKLDPDCVFLNHGSFGACPAAVLEKQQEYRNRFESQPIRFVLRELEELMHATRTTLAELVNADPADLVFVRNATEGVNTVFRSLRFLPGDEILFTSHLYGACKRVLEMVAETTGARLVEVTCPFPIASENEITGALLSRVNARTRIALIDHITSATAIIQPVETLVRELDRLGVDTMIDGAHAPGSIPLNLENIGAAYYTANGHKWLCAPKGVAFLHVRRDRQRNIMPLAVSHAGHRAEPFTERFFWPGTHDPSAVLALGDAIRYMGSLVPGGWPSLMARNRALCLEAREMLCDILSLPKPCPDEMIACMATFPLPAPSTVQRIDYKGIEPLQELLNTSYGIEIPVWNWDHPPSRLIRIAVQLYNSIDQYHYLGRVLAATARH